MRALAFFALAVPVGVASLLACNQGATSENESTGEEGPIPVAEPEPTSAGESTSTTLPVPAREPDVDVTSETMSFEGYTRKYLLARPRDYNPSRQYPLVMLFHGNPGTKEEMRKVSPFELASHREAVLVYPDARDGGWDHYTPTESNRDMSWIQALPAAVATRVNVDQSRVYGYGFSGGAFMMAQMGCRFGASVFRAIAIHSGGGPKEDQMGFEQQANKCYSCPGGPIPTLVIHGENDGVVVKTSGAFTAMCFSGQNQCADSPKRPVSPAPCMAADGCARPVEWCLIPGLGHKPWENAQAKAWAFFKAS